MSPRRRLMLQSWPWSLGSLAALSPKVSVGAASQPVVSDPLPLQFPRDHGAHLGQRIEWWYATGWLTR